MNIKYYIMYNLYEPNIANNILNGLKKKITLLKDFPYIGRKVGSYQERVLIFKNYLIFYEIQENKNLILIIRIIHTKMYHK